MGILRHILKISPLLLLAAIGTGNADERLDVKDFQLTDVCTDTVEEHGLKTFEIDDRFSTPTVTVRQADAELFVAAVYFEPYFHGILFKRNDEAVLHCYVHYFRPNYILLERSERWMTFENGARQTTEAHIHSYISCGSNCGFSRYESITFFDDPKVSKEDEGKLHSYPVPPLYWLGGDTHPNEYPSRWFRAYLTEEERVTFDRIINEG